MVKDSIASPTAFYEATANWNSGGTAVVDHTSGNAPTTIANARIVRNTGDSAFYKSKGDFTAVSTYVNDSAITAGSTFADTVKSDQLLHSHYDIETSFTNTNDYNTTKVVQEGRLFPIQANYYGSWGSTRRRGRSTKWFTLPPTPNLSQFECWLHIMDPPGRVAGWTAVGANLNAASSPEGRLLLEKTIPPIRPATNWWNDAHAVNLSNTGHGNFSTYWDDGSADIALGTIIISDHRPQASPTPPTGWKIPTLPILPPTNLGAMPSKTLRFGHAERVTGASAISATEYGKR